MIVKYHDDPGLDDSTAMDSPSVPFGLTMRDAHFAFSPDYTPLNHGSFGTYPKSVGDVLTKLSAEAEAAPDKFISLDWPARLKESRGLAAGLLNCATEDLVFVPNATTGTDTILKNLVWEKGDVILMYEVVYDSVRAGVAYLQDMFGVSVEMVPISFPLSDDALIQALVDAVREVNARPGQRVRLAIVDTIVSMPGIRIPFERLVPALQAEGPLVHVDGAHGIGHVDIDIKKLNPDFFVTNLHKWLYVPRGCAALYVAKKHQKLIRTSLPTSHVYRRPGDDRDLFVQLFDFTGTANTTNYLCVKAALDFRSQICGGEASIQAWCKGIAREAADAAATFFSTDVMDCPDSCMRDCNLHNVRLPVKLIGTEEEGSTEGIHVNDAAKVVLWIKIMGVKESGMYFQTCAYRNSMYWRLSGQIYVDVEDFVRGAKVLKGLCERAIKGEYHAYSHASGSPSQGF
ncbi:putative aminotransferase family protein [Xylariaceae sp. FL1272]|nr:putative aminotransferase family protein [Xylariaceae sp. FL1272]